MASRMPEIAYEDLTAEQKKAYDLIASTRNGNVNGPFPAWIRIPELCFSIQGVSDILRSNTSFDKRIFEMITIVVARHYCAGYMWAAHSRFAIKAGLSEKIVDEINSGIRPQFASFQEQIIFDVADTLAAGKLLPIDTYEDAVDILGYDKLIEVATDVGFYSMIAAVLNTFDVQPTENSIPLKILKPER